VNLTRFDPNRPRWARRAPDLLVATMIVGWVIACNKNKKKSTPPPAAPVQQLAASDAEAARSSAVVASQPTSTSGSNKANIAGLEAVAASGKCKAYSDFDDKLDMARAFEHDKLEAAVKPGGVSHNPLAEWTLLANYYVDLCPGEADSTEVGDLMMSTEVDERMVDAAVKEKRCGLLTSIDAADRWPYEVTFAEQLQGRNFGDAEVTRVLWRDTLQEFVDGCGDAISRRKRIAATTRIAKLDRIIGLDDEVLIDLRSKVLTAMENGKPEAILAYSRAINEREKALDSRNAARYDAKLAEIEQLVESQAEELEIAKKEAKEAKLSKQQVVVVQNGPSKSKNNGADMVQTTANIAKTAKNVHDTVKTAKSIGKAFGL
jgi:hypothetical protein